MVTQHKLCTNKILNANWYASRPKRRKQSRRHCKTIDKNLHHQLPTVQVTNIEIHHAIHQLLNFDECGLVNPVTFVVTVRGRALHRQLLPIPHVSLQLPPVAWALCAAKADIYARVVYLHARQGTGKVILNFESSHHTAYRI